MSMARGLIDAQLWDEELNTTCGLGKAARTRLKAPKINVIFSTQGGLQRLLRVFGSHSSAPESCKAVNDMFHSYCKLLCVCVCALLGCYNPDRHRTQAPNQEILEGAWLRGHVWCLPDSILTIFSL